MPKKASRKNTANARTIQAALKIPVTELAGPIEWPVLFRSEKSPELNLHLELHEAMKLRRDDKRRVLRLMEENTPPGKWDEEKSPSGKMRDCVRFLIGRKVNGGQVAGYVAFTFELEDNFELQEHQVPTMYILDNCWDDDWQAGDLPTLAFRLMNRIALRTNTRAMMITAWDLEQQKAHYEFLTGQGFTRDEGTIDGTDSVVMSKLINGGKKPQIERKAIRKDRPTPKQVKAIGGGGGTASSQPSKESQAERKQRLEMERANRRKQAEQRKQREEAENTQNHSGQIESSGSRPIFTPRRGTGPERQPDNSESHTGDTIPPKRNEPQIEKDRLINEQARLRVREALRQRVLEARKEADEKRVYERSQQQQTLDYQRTGDDRIRDHEMPEIQSDFIGFPEDVYPEQESVAAPQRYYGSGTESLKSDSDNESNDEFILTD